MVDTDSGLIVHSEVSKSETAPAEGQMLRRYMS